MSAVSTLILRSMRMIGEKPRGSTLDSNEQVETLYELNSMLDSWNTEKLMCYSIQQDSTPLTASTGAYTIGPGATINSNRPVRIVDPCFIRDSANADTPVQIIDAATYGSIVLKSTGYTYPTYLYYDNGYSATSTATINVWPLPQGGLTLYVNSWKQVGNFSTLSQEVMFPPGYQEAIESNFALRLAAGFVDPPAVTVKLAKDSKAALKSVNIDEPLMTLDTAVGYRRRSSIITGP